MSDSSSNSSCSSCLGCLGFLLVIVLLGSTFVRSSGFSSIRVGPFNASIGSDPLNEQKNGIESNQSNADAENLAKEASAELSRYHDSLSKGEFKEIYERSSPQLKASTSQEDFFQTLQKTQDLCGKSKSSELLNIWKPIAGGQTGPFLISRHLTVFEKSSFIEEFTWVTSNGKLALISSLLIPVSSSDQIPIKKTAQ